MGGAPASLANSPSGVIGGGQFGYNAQFGNVDPGIDPSLLAQLPVDNSVPTVVTGVPGGAVHPTNERPQRPLEDDPAARAS